MTQEETENLSIPARSQRIELVFLKLPERKVQCRWHHW
jgi:hypothetical protein